MNRISLFSMGYVILAVVFSFCKTKVHQHQTENIKDPITHSFFIAGPSFTGIIGEKNEVIWDAQKPAARDGYVLDNGHVLICWSDEVREYDVNKEVIFTYKKSEQNDELGTVERLANGNTLVTELGNTPRLLEINSNSEIKIDVPLLPETDNAHMQTRMARKLDNGNYLVPHLLAFTVKEYTPLGEVIQTFKTDLSELGGKEAENWPFTAIRLSNGNTVVGLTHGNKVVELDDQGSVVWQISNNDLEGDPIDDACGIQRLSNGNTVIASYHAQQGIKLFEVTNEKKIVWKYDGPHNVHHFQILTTNGKTLKGKPMK